jgi:hypothetical protein
MTDEQFKQLMDKLEEIKKALPVVPAMPTYQVAPSLPQPPYVPCDPPYPGPFTPHAGGTPGPYWQGGNIIVAQGG